MEKEYPVGLVGEQHYQDAVAKCSVGDMVFVLQEIGNPFDEDALVVKRKDGDTLGYIAKDSFVQGVYHEQGASVSARIDAIEYRSGFKQIVLKVTIVDQEGSRTAYTPANLNAMRSSQDPDIADIPADQKSNVVTPALAVVGSLMFLGAGGSSIAVIFLLISVGWLLKRMFG